MYFPVGLTEAEAQRELEYASGLRERPGSTLPWTKVAGVVALVGFLTWMVTK